MGIFDKLKKKTDTFEQNNALASVATIEKTDNYSLVEMNNYMLSDIKKENLSQSSYSLTISKLSEVSPIAVSTVDNIKKIRKENPKATDQLYRITNLGKNDSLKAMKDGKTFWGAIKKAMGNQKWPNLRQ